jgi:hypothetical protein
MVPSMQTRQKTSCQGFSPVTAFDEAVYRESIEFTFIPRFDERRWLPEIHAMNEL